eukprot:6192516-Pleurochrysis_carterae.AAC.1
MCVLGGNGERDRVEGESAMPAADRGPLRPCRPVPARRLLLDANARSVARHCQTRPVLRCRDGERARPIRAKPMHWYAMLKMAHASWPACCSCIHPRSWSSWWSRGTG